MRGIDEVHRLDGLRWHDIHTKFHKDWSAIQKLIGEIHRHSMAKSLLFFKNKERGVTIKKRGPFSGIHICHFQNCIV
jgi:hypothetical protein